MNGQGELTQANGIYIGEFVNDVKNGKGIFKWQDGTQYEGEFLNGKQHGNGIITDKNGRKKDEKFHNGNRVSRLTSSIIK